MKSRCTRTRQAGTDADDEPETGVGDAAAVAPETTPSEAGTPGHNKRGAGPSGGEQGTTPATKRTKGRAGEFHVVCESFVCGKFLDQCVPITTASDKCWESCGHGRGQQQLV